MDRSKALSGFSIHWEITFFFENKVLHTLSFFSPLSTYSVSAHLTVVEPESHVLLLDAEPLGQVQVDVLDGAHAAEAARVGEHPLQGSVGRRHASRWGSKARKRSQTQHNTRTQFIPPQTGGKNWSVHFGDVLGWGGVGDRRLVVRKQQERIWLLNHFSAVWLVDRFSGF